MLPRKLTDRRGMTLTEVVFSMSILLMCAFVFTAVFPMSTQSRTKADHRSTAISLAQRQLEAARDAGYTPLQSYESLYSRGLVDASSSTSPYSFTNVTMGSGHSVNNSLPQATATMAVTTQNNQPATVSVTVSWNEQNRTRSVTLSTMIANI